MRTYKPKPRFCLLCGVLLPKYQHKFCDDHKQKGYHLKWDTVRKVRYAIDPEYRERERKRKRMVLITNQKYAEKQKEHQRIKSKRRKNLLKGLPHTLTLVEWRDTLAYFGNLCAYCCSPLTKTDQDHFIPASKGGGYTKENIVPACPTCNNKKRGQMPLEWLVMQEHGIVRFAEITAYLQMARVL